MKILQVIPNLQSGGAESFTVELTLELCRKGHDCEILTLFDDSNSKLRSKLGNYAKVSSLHKKLGFDFKSLIKLYQYVKTGNYEVVHAHVNAIPYILISCLLLRKVRFVATIHSDAKFEAGGAFSKWVRFLLFKTNLCTPVTISEESLLSFKKFYGINAPMIYNGLSDYSPELKESLRDNKDQTLFVHPASCQEVKNQRLLFKAFARLTKDYPNVKMIWVGSNSSNGSLFDELQNEMVEQIQYLGVVPNVRDYLVQADAMCLSSRLEGMPMTVIEAFSVGCPSICTPVGGMVNMIRHNVNGLLSVDLSVDGYYEVLLNFMKQTKVERDNMRMAALLSFSRYGIDACASEYLKVYSKYKK